MNREDPYREQAERHRKKIERNQKSVSKGEKAALPPRSIIHREKRNQNKWKLKFPLIRLLALFFILLPITIFSIYNYLESENRGKAEDVSVQQSGFETVGFEEKGKDKGTKIEINEDYSKSESEVLENEKEKNNVDSTKNVSKSASKEDKGNKESEKPGENIVEMEKEEKLDSKVKEVTNNQEEVTEKEEPIKKEESKKEANIVYHTVQPQETIYRIAMKYYKSQSGIAAIKQANNLGSNEIRVGQVLSIPLN